MELLTTDTFKSKIFNYEQGKDWKYDGSLPAVVDFYADWCGPCKMLMPILEEISMEYLGRVQFYKVNTETAPAIASVFNVRGVSKAISEILEVGD